MEKAKQTWKQGKIGLPKNNKLSELKTLIKELKTKIETNKAEKFPTLNSKI